MMHEFFSQLGITYGYYFGYGFLALLLVAGAMWIIYAGTDVQKRILVALPVCVIVLTLLNPVYYKLAGLTADYTYARSYWNVPFFLILACMWAALVRKTGKSNGIGISAVMVLMILLWGYGLGSVNREHNLFYVRDNIYRVPQNTVDIADMITNDCDGEPVVYAPADICRFMRTYDADIKLVYHDWWKELSIDYGTYSVDDEELIINYQTVYDFINSDEINYKAIMQLQKLTGWNYVVLKEDGSRSVMQTEYGLVRLGTVDGYNIYKNAY